MGKMNMRLARLLTVCVLCLAMTVGSGVTAAAKSKKKSSVISDKDSPVIIVWEDEYLHELTESKGITDIADLSPIEDGIYLWQGDITTLKCGAIVNAANSE